MRGLKAEIGSELAGFISLRSSIKTIIKEVAEAGAYKYEGASYNCIQLLTIKKYWNERKNFMPLARLGKS